MGREGLIRVVDRSAGLLLIGLVIYYAIGQSLLQDSLWPPVDYSILYDGSRAIVQNERYAYPPSYLYAPSGVSLIYLTALLPISAAGVLWMTWSIAATIGSFVLGTSLVGLSGHPWRWTLALSAFGLMEHYIAWDLRCQNSNMLYCFLLIAALWAVARQRDKLSGMLLAVSVALKLYPALVIGYLLLVGKRRAFVAATAGVLLLFLGLPALVFGPSSLVGIYLSWIDHVQFMLTAIKSPSQQIIDTLPIIALRFTFHTRMNLDPAVTSWLLITATTTWCAIVVGCWLARRPWSKSEITGWDLAVDGGLMAVGPIMLSPYLESYHLVPALVLVLALLARTTDVRLSWTLRLAPLAALCLGWTAMKVSGRLDYLALTYRGLGVYAQMLLLVASLAIVRWFSPRESIAPALSSSIPAPKGRKLARSAELATSRR